MSKNNGTGKTYAIYNTDQNYYVTKTRTSHMTYKTRWPHVLLPIVNHTSAKCRWQSPSSLSANLWMCDKKDCKKDKSRKPPCSTLECKLFKCDLSCGPRCSFNGIFFSCTMACCKIPWSLVTAYWDHMTKTNIIKGNNNN